MKWLPEIRKLIPRALIDGPGWNRLLQRVGELPGESEVSRCGFEFRLGEAPAVADFFVVVVPGQALAKHYVRQAEAAPPGSPTAALGRYLVQLGEPEAAPRWIAGTMLEYDIAAAEEEDSAPGVFLRVRRARECRGAQRWSPRELTATVARAVGWEQDQGEQQAVERVCAALPPGGEVVHIGALPGRSPRAVRLVLHGIGHAQLTHLLERLEWAGSIRTPQAVLAGLRKLLPRFWLAVDVSATGVLPRLGLELYHAGQGERELTAGGQRAAAIGDPSWSGWSSTAGVCRRKHRGCCGGARWTESTTGERSISSTRGSTTSRSRSRKGASSMPRRTPARRSRA